MVTTRTVPFQHSTVLGGWQWTTASDRYPGTNSDMHWCAQAADGSHWFVDDDGWNFGRRWNFAHLLLATGKPPHHELVEVTDFPELVRPEGLRCRRYVDGALCVDDRLYVAAYDYADDIDGLADTFHHIDLVSPHGGVVALMYSDDEGRTFQNVPGPEIGPEDYFLGPRFAGLSFVAFGPGYTGIPAELGEYVYAISNDSNWETGDHVFLARVPRNEVLDREAWEFWAGAGEGAFPAEPTWTRREDAARPVLRDPGHVGHPTMTYVPTLRRFLLLYSTDPVPHLFHTAPDEALSTWVRQTELVVLEAPAPWGPWRLVHHDPAWEHPHTPYLPQLPTGWLDDDGLGGWLVFSGDYVVPDAAGEYYGFMTRQFRIDRLPDLSQ